MQGVCLDISPLLGHSLSFTVYYKSDHGLSTTGLRLFQRTYSVALKKDVAIKIIERDEAPEVFQERFLPREVDILSQIKHPNIITIYQIFETAEPGRVYIVSEFMRYGDLLDLVKVCFKLWNG